MWVIRTGHMNTQLTTLTRTSAARSGMWIPQPRPKPGAHLRLFGFPSAGTGASAYRNWSNVLPSHVEFIPVQLPGRENRLRDTAYDQVAPLVATLAEVLWPYLTPPFAFFGHSMGALIAFELTRHLRREFGISPAHLFISGHRAPHLHNPFPALHKLPDPNFVQELQNRYGGIPEVILKDPELLQTFLPVLRADLKLVESYAYLDDRPLDCPLSVFGGLQDTVVSQHEIAAWRRQTFGKFTVRMFPGDHFFVQKSQAQLVGAIAQDLTRHLFDAA